jgi:hypothetical protein
MTDEDQEKQKEESAARQKEAIAQEAKELKAQGFNKDQIAAQLSAKHQISVDEAAAAVGDDDGEEKKDA